MVTPSTRLSWIRSADPHHEVATKRSSDRRSGDPPMGRRFTASPPQGPQDASTSRRVDNATRGRDRSVSRAAAACRTAPAFQHLRRALVFADRARAGHVRDGWGPAHAGTRSDRPPLARRRAAAPRTGNTPAARDGPLRPLPQPGWRLRALPAGLPDALYERHRDADGLVTLRDLTEIWCARRHDTLERA